VIASVVAVVSALPAVAASLLVASVLHTLAAVMIAGSVTMTAATVSVLAARLIATTSRRTRMMTARTTASAMVPPMATIGKVRLLQYLF
jgi:hypothetical protein